MIKTRREFCTHACHAASLAAAGALIGCGKSSPSAPGPVNNTPAPGTALSSVPATVSGRTVSVTTTGTSLASVGGAAMTTTSIGTFLITQTSQDTFSVLTATCTHEACTVNGFSNARFLCPCHGSQFSTGGGVLVGPATQPLRQFAATFANGTLTFTA